MPHAFPRTIAVLALLAALVGLAAPPSARADVTVDVNQGALQPMPIAIAGFSGAQAQGDISAVISNDLQSSGLFRPLDPSTFPDKAPNANILPKFADWKSINAQALVDGQVSIDSDGRLQVDFHLFDVFSGTELKAARFTAAPESWRRVAHKIADAVYERLTGEQGYFDSRVAFVAESGPKSKRVRRLAIMDQDGANPQFLTDGTSYQVFNPRFSGVGQEITYMALRDSGASIYLFDIQTGRQETLGHYTGMVFAPRFSPDGSKIAYSVEQAGNTDIYVMDLHNRSSRRLTTDPSIDTSPAFSPDGSQLVFNSDRGGSPQLYVMGADGSAPHRISFGSGRYTTPVWSPRGDMIAFTKQTGSTFHIGVMKPDGSGERILTTSFLDEGPTWAPNGRVLMFFRETPGGGARLWTIDVSGRVERPEPYPGSASDPAWSPLLN